MYERELISLVQAVRYWQPYLSGRAFLIHTDRYNLKYLLDQCLYETPTTVGKQVDWLPLLCGLHVRREQRGGKHALMPQLRGGCTGVGIDDTHDLALQ
jgi:hypothetical protein